MGYLAVLDTTLVVNVEDDRVGELVLIGAQRTDVVAQALGQHGDGAVDKVYRCGAVLCLLVDDAVLAHVMGDIGNVYAHLPEVLSEGTDGESIVEVLGIVGVDGAGEHIAHIESAGYLVGGDDVADMVGRILHGNGVFVGESKLGKDGVHLYIIVTSLTKDVHHMTYGVACILGPFHNLHHRLVATLAALELVARDEDVVVERTALGKQEGIVAFHLEDAHEGVIGPLDDLYHLALGHATPTTTGKEAHAHTVAMQGMHRVTFGNVYRLVILIGGKENLAIARTLDDTREFAFLEYEAEMSVGGLHEGAVDEQVAYDVATQHLLRMRGEA